MEKYNADQLLQKVKELKELLYILKDVNSQQKIKSLQQAKDILTSIENGEIEGCEEEICIEGYEDKHICGNHCEFCEDTFLCPSCKQKINEAEKILREVLE